MQLIKRFFKEFDLEQLAMCAFIIVLGSIVLGIVGGIVFLLIWWLGMWFIIGVGIFLVLVFGLYFVLWYFEIE